MNRVIRNKRTGQVVTECPALIAELRLGRYPETWEELFPVDETFENPKPEPEKKPTRKRKPKAE